MIAVIDEKFNFEYINERAHLEIIGYMKNDLIGKPIHEHTHPEDLKSGMKDLRKGLKYGVGSAEFRYKHKNGHYIWMEIRGRTFKTKEGKTKILAITREITKRKKIEQELEDSKEKYQKIIENTKEGYFEVDLKGKFIFFNDAFTKLIDYDKKEVINSNYSKFMTNENAKKTFQTFNKVYRGEITEKSLRYEFIAKSGETIFGESSVYLRHDSKGKKIGFAGFIRDITEQKKAEIELEKSEKRYRLITENANDLIAVMNDKFEYEYINEEVHKRINGYSKEDVIGLSALEIIHPDDLKMSVKKLRDSFKKKGSEDMAEVRIRHKDGHWMWFEVRGRTFIDTDGGLKGLVISRVIDERKQAEQKLKESEEKYRFISENANDLIRIVDKNFKNEYINELTHLRLLGYSQEDLIKKSARDLYHPEEVEQVNKYLRYVIKTGEGRREGRIKHKNGQWIWFDMRAKLIENDRGDLKGLVIARDITERKETEKKLKESEEKYRKIFNASPDFISVTNIEGDILDANLSLLNRTCLSLNNIRRKNIVDLFTEDESLDLMSKKTEVKGRLLTGENYEYEIIGIPLEEEGKTSRVLHLICLLYTSPSPRD